MIFFNKKAAQPKKEMQYIGFPVESYDLLSKSEKNFYYMMVKKGNWEFSIRAMGWIIESRFSDEPLPDDSQEHIFGVRNARVFTQKEVDDLREYNRISDQSYILGEVTPGEEKLKGAFEEFARKVGLVRLPYLRVLRVMCLMASEGREVKPVDLRTNPVFRRLGNVHILFGDRLAEILEFQNQHARQSREAATQ